MIVKDDEDEDEDDDEDEDAVGSGSALEAVRSMIPLLIVGVIVIGRQEDRRSGKGVELGYIHDIRTVPCGRNSKAIPLTTLLLPLY
jgi:hypothetical protein